MTHLSELIPAVKRHRSVYCCCVLLY